MQASSNQFDWLKYDVAYTATILAGAITEAQFELLVSIELESRQSITAIEALRQ